MKHSRSLFITGISLLALIGVVAPLCAAPPAYLRTIGSPGTAPGQLGLVTGVAIGSDGDVFVLDGAYVSRFHPDGTFVSRWDPCIGLIRPEQNAQGLQSDRNGTIYVSTRGGGLSALVREFDESGALIADHNGDGPGNTLGEPWGMGYTASFGLAIADMTAGLWRLHGGLLTRLPNGAGCAPGEVWSPTGVAILAGNLYVTEYSERLQRLDSGGGFIAELGSTGGCGSIRGYPRFVAPDGAGGMVVVDMLTNVAQIVGTSGGVLATWGGTGTGHGSLYGADGAAVGSDGLIYIADGWNGRIEVYSPGPTAATASTWGRVKTLYR